MPEEEVGGKWKFPELILEAAVESRSESIPYPKPGRFRRCRPPFGREIIFLRYSKRPHRFGGDRWEPGRRRWRCKNWRRRRGGVLPPRPKQGRAWEGLRFQRAARPNFLSSEGAPNFPAEAQSFHPPDPLR